MLSGEFFDDFFQISSDVDDISEKLCKTSAFNFFLGSFTEMMRKTANVELGVVQKFELLESQMEKAWKNEPCKGVPILYCRS